MDAIDLRQGAEKKRDEYLNDTTRRMTHSFVSFVSCERLASNKGVAISGPRGGDANKGKGLGHGVVRERRLRVARSCARK